MAKQQLYALKYVGPENKGITAQAVWGVVQTANGVGLTQIHRVMTWQDLKKFENDKNPRMNRKHYEVVGVMAGTKTDIIGPVHARNSYNQPPVPPRHAAAMASARLAELSLT